MVRPRTLLALVPAVDATLPMILRSEPVAACSEPFG